MSQLGCGRRTPSVFGQGRRPKEFERLQRQSGHGSCLGDDGMNWDKFYNYVNTSAPVVKEDNEGLPMDACLPCQGMRVGRAEFSLKS